MMYLYPKPGGEYRHTKTGNIYTVQCVLPIKLDGEWCRYGATIYTSNKTNDSFVRVTDDFLDSFERVVDETNG